MADINPAPIKEQMYMPNGSMSQSWVHWFQETFQVLAGRKQGLVNAANADTVDTFHASQTPGVNTTVVSESSGKFAFGWMPSETIIGMGYYQTSAYQSLTATLPFDDTIPQVSEFAQAFTLAYTPKESGSILEIDVIVEGNGSVGGHYYGVGLWKDSDTAVMAAISKGENVGVGFSTLRYQMTSLGASSITFKVGVGSSGGSAFYLNGAVGSRLYGGTRYSSVRVLEYRA